MKKFICGILVGLICTLSIGTLATGIWDNISVLKNDIKIVVNGNEVAADNFVYEDTTYLPLRAVSEALEQSVEYDETTNTAYIGERKDDSLSNNEIKSKYIPTSDLLNNDQYYFEVVNGYYYISEYTIRKFYGIGAKELDEMNNTMLFVLNDKEKWVSYIVNNGRAFIPYDTFMEEIYPCIQ